MPYIKDEHGRRIQLSRGATALNAGELNFQIFYYVKNSNPVYYEKIRYFTDEFLSTGRTYQKYNDLTGALVCCYKEIKRRLNREEDVLLDVLESYNEEINAYEDIKIGENGDV